MLAVQKAWGYEMSDGCRRGGGGGGGGRRGRRGGRADVQPSTITTAASRENARGLGDADGASLATALHEMEQDLRREESTASLLQQQIVYDKYLSAVPFLQERKLSLPAFHSTLIAAYDTLESAVTTSSSQPVQQQTVTDSLLLSTSPAAMEQQQVPGLLLPTTYTSSHNSLVPGISRSGSLDLDTGASLATVAFQCETQAAVIRNEAAVGAAVTEWEANVGGDATKVSQQLLAGVKRARGGGSASADHNAQEFLEEVQQQFRKNQQRSETTTSARWKRPIDQAEHIARERQRRDNMTSRFSTLETLLPPGPKVTTTMMSLLNVFAQFCCSSRLETVAIAPLDYDLVKFLCLRSKRQCRFLDRSEVCFVLRCNRRFCFLVQVSTGLGSLSKPAPISFLDRSKRRFRLLIEASDDFVS